MEGANLAPDAPDLGSPDLLLRAVDVNDLLAQVEAASGMSANDDLMRNQWR